MRCTAKAKTTGKQCGSWARQGMNVCRMHGGSAPQTIAAAKRRLLEEFLPSALIEMKAIIDSPDTPPAVKLAAIRDVLDRVGLKPVTELEVTHITEDALDREIARLEAELAGVGES